MIKLTQMSIRPGVRKVFDPEATEVSGNSQAEDFFDGGANGGDHNTSPSDQRKGSNRVPLGVENGIVHASSASGAPNPERISIQLAVVTRFLVTTQLADSVTSKRKSC
jgi:hypothetical protein